MSVFIESIQNESLAWKIIQQLRSDFSPSLVEKVAVADIGQAMERGISVVSSTLQHLQTHGLGFDQIDPGHARGHFVRDYVNAVRLFPQLEISPREAFVGFCAGILHDIGNSVVKRYDESHRAIRHAEAAALLLGLVWQEFDSGLNEYEQMLIEYACAAHTHYRKEQSVQCADGQTRIITPYQELDENGRPIYLVWTARWTDRLDTNGPAFVGRHFLTLVDAHKDFDGKDFVAVNFEEHLNTDPEAAAHTMWKHMKMFAGSQNNESPYGCHDLPRMQEIRDKYKKQLFAVIDAVQKPHELTAADENDFLSMWVSFLSKNCEPTANGEKVAQVLADRFTALPKKDRDGWLWGFRETMIQYERWAQDVLIDLDQNEYYQNELPMIGNVGEAIASHPSWSGEFTG